MQIYESMKNSIGSLVLRKDVVVIPEVIIFYVLIIENIFMIDCWM